MAIQIDIQNTQYGVPFKSAYFRIAGAAVLRQRQRQGEPKFSVLLDVSGFGTSKPTDDTHAVDARRYHAALEDVEAQPGDTFLDRCYAWVMLQDDMQGCVAV